MNIDCPAAGMPARVTNGTICVHGILTDGDVGQLVAGHVLPGSVSVTSLPQAPLSTDPTTPVQGRSFCVMNVPVPYGTTTGATLTAVVWLINSNTPGVPLGTIFTAGDASATDCCSGCSGGAAQFQFAVALAEQADLVVDIPSGANAGSHRAVAVASLTWELTVAGVAHTVAVAGGELVIRGPSGSAAAAVEFEPFSATFAGGLFGSDDDVVLTIP